ncbi:GTPase [Streptosporangium saharense]|uniref:GTP-binding protein EngB required for normal cell division n=1 Tax=Streptosporangium saharense TaxID=1706840 RepID=A0A7W7QQ64_9ACTN|nr:GTPase [Streptosporangium saharense]MBB4917643.1 GTP-binding protein EngB required for normal cell division [Streptosporangium saharense]
MKLLRRKEAASLDDRLDALARAADLAEGRLAEDVVAGARSVVARAGVRRGLSVGHTVVALAGATGSGKSSLFNALSGTELATVGVTRPTTSTAQAALWDGEGAGPLLDWLEVPRRHEVPNAEGEAAGLILLDLPDHDSIEPSHRLEVDRLVEMVDLLVWVLDPQKYADAAVHDRYLRPLAGHRDVTVVVLNQIDRLSQDAARRCLDDLRRLLDEDGLGGVPLFGISTRTGTGMHELGKLLAARVADRRSWATRLSADVGTAAARLDTASGTGKPSREDVDGLAGPLTAALSDAAGVPVVVRAVATSHRHRSIAATGWPPTRWLRRFRPDPLRRLRLAAQTEGPVGRTSMPAVSAVQRSKMDTAIRRTADTAAEGLPEPWAAAVRRAARSHGDELEDGLDRAVAATSLGSARKPVWWRVVGLAQWLVFAVALAGGLWLLGLAGLDYLRLPRPYMPTAGELPWPTVLLVGGILLGLLIAGLSRLAAWAGGRRRARKAGKALRANVDRVGRDLVLTPINDEVTRHKTFTEALTVAEGSERRAI